MNPVKFPQSNVVMAKDQPEYKPLPAHRTEDGKVISCWQPTEEEKQAIAEGKPIWLWCWTFNHPLQPVLLTMEDPWK